MLAVREQPDQRYSEVFGLGAKEQGFVVEADFQLTFSFLVVEMEGCRHRFVVLTSDLDGSLLLLITAQFNSELLIKLSTVF